MITEIRFRRLQRTLLIAGAMILVGSAAHAATDEDIYNQLRFNFFNPGGRALGMGGAAIAATFDSTASLANPAALVNLTTDEFFAEFRGNFFDEDNPSFQFDNVGAVSGTTTTELASPTYISYLKTFLLSKASWRLALSRHELANAERRISGQRLRFDAPVGNGQFFDTTVDGFADLDIVQYGIGLAGRLKRNWSVGVTGVYATMNLDSEGSSVTRDPFNLLSSGNPAEVLDPQTFRFSTRIDDLEDSSPAGSIGLYWQPSTVWDADPPLKLGLTYSLGPDFEVPITVIGADGTTVLQEGRRFRLKVPDRYGVGVLKRWPTPSSVSSSPLEFRLAVDAVWVAFEDLLEGFESGLNTFTRPGREIAGEEVGINFTVDDGLEVRVGLDWSLLLGDWTLGWRTGYSRSPSGVIYADRIFEVGGDGVLDPALAEGLTALYLEKDDVDAFSIGFSLSFSRGAAKLNSSLDVGYQHSDENQQAVVSTILRF